MSRTSAQQPRSDPRIFPINSGIVLKSGSGCSPTAPIDNGYIANESPPAGTNFKRSALLTGLPRGTPAVEAAHPVDAGSTVETGGPGAVVYVDGTVGSGPAVDAYAGEAAHAVRARRAVLAHRRAEGALVHVLLAEASRIRGGTLARVTVDPVDARGAVLAPVPRTVVDVLLAVLSAETWNGRIIKPLFKMWKLRICVLIGGAFAVGNNFSLNKMCLQMDIKRKHTLIRTVIIFTRDQNRSNG